MTATTDFRKFISEKLDFVLKPRGFTRRGYSFAKTEDGNRQILEFQTWRKRGAFTVNLGIYSSRIWSYEKGEKPLPAFPLASDSHWWTRLGHLLPEPKDRWWPLPRSDNVGVLADEVRAALEAYAIPTLNRFHTDEALRDFWLSGKCMGISAGRRDFNLVILLAEIGPTQLFERFLAQYRSGQGGTPFDLVSDSDIAMILSRRGQRDDAVEASNVPGV